ncbi:ABSCISIC ACID-INSENSITIVE 5-like protein 3 [Diospyros lotus]|uniref:ABSCISIC ACID-INSENSITIVE 5-like protein 3 n=1 Tax=Diospyros lotus TaxID=55363 RepID=UPI002255383A|nr:ABSCISIC ACID-INSENSITIVE 5-like protein 3 [Diospyros lotus]
MGCYRANFPILPPNDVHFDDLAKTVISADQEGKSNQTLSSSSSCSSSSGSIFLENFSRKTLDFPAADDIKPLHQYLGGLGDFLVNPQPLMEIDPMVVVPQQQPDWFKFPAQVFQHQTAGSNFPIFPEFETAGVKADLAETQLGLPVPVGNEIQRWIKDEMMEKTIERRQKRMIKNRESAARSRARKQAYTNKLEFKASQLKETICCLLKRKDMNMLLSSPHSTPLPLPRYQLRRTSSAHF